MTSRKLELALRRNTGRQLLPKMLDDLSRSLGKPGESIVLLDLERTDEIRDALQQAQQSYRNNPNAAFQRTWPASEIEGVKSVLNKLKERAPDRPLYLLRALSNYCGAVETTSSEILGHAFRLIGLDQEEIIAVNDDASYGLLLGYNTNWSSTGSVEVYDLLVWGEEWLAALRDKRSPA